MMKIGALIIVLILIISGVFAFVYLQRTKVGMTTEPQVNKNSSTVETTLPTVVSMGVALIPQNDSKILGGVELTDMGDKTKVSIKLTNEGASIDAVPHPAHIHTGSCPTPGEVKYPLSNVLNGVSETVINVSLSALSADLPLAINIHKSATESSNYLACGNLPSSH